MDSTRKEPNQPNGLLAALVPYGVLVQPEVALTGGICWILGLEGAVGALDELVRRNGFEPGVDGRWLTEVGGDGGRTDLEYQWGEPPQTRVVVEAKIGHALSVSQIAGYVERLQGDVGLLVVLVPESRRPEGERVIGEYRDLDPDEAVSGGRVGLDVWSYDDVTSALETRLPTSSDVAQFKGLAQASNALDIYPISQPELMDDNSARREDIWKVVDTASFWLFGRRNPMGSDGSLEQRRYVWAGRYDVEMAAGVGRARGREGGEPWPWAWLRVPDSGGFARIAQRVVQDLRPSDASHDGTNLWLPLTLPPETSGSGMIQVVRDEIESVALAIQGAIDEEIAEHEPVAADLRESLRAVLGIEPIDPTDLLDSSPSRKDDIQILLREAARSFSGTRKLSDSNFEVLRYIGVPPFSTCVATCLGRESQPPAGTSQTWAWLRVHNLTPYSDSAQKALRSLAPEEAVTDTLGVAIPIRIPTGAGGPDMFLAIRQQVEEAMVVIRSAVQSRELTNE